MMVIKYGALRILVIGVVALLLFAGTAMGEVSRDGLVAEWHFDEGSGTVLKDSSANRNDGIIYGATWVDGKYGKALSFDGSNDYVTVQDSASVDIISTITIEAWIKFYQGSTQSIISKSSLSQNNAYVFPRFDKTNQLTFWLNAGGWQILNVGNVFPYGEWHHVAGTYDGLNMNVYVDGILTGNQKSVSGAITTNSNPLTIGYQPGTSEFFYGSIDEVRIYNRALTADEVKSHYEGKQSSLSVTKTTSPQSIKQGQTSTVTISVENTGTTDISDIEIADTMPSDVSFVSGEISKKYTTLRAKDVREFQYVVKINDVGTFNLDPAQATYADDEGNYYSIESNAPSIKTIASLDSSSNQETSNYESVKDNDEPIDVQVSGKIPGFGAILSIFGIVLVFVFRRRIN